MRISDWSSDVFSSDLCRIERRADSVEVLGGPVEIDRVPVGKRRNQQVQPRCAKFLIFQRARGEPTLPVGLAGGGTRLPRPASVENGLTGKTRFRLFTPMERDKSAPDRAQFNQGKTQPDRRVVGGNVSTDT